MELQAQHLQRSRRWLTALATFQFDLDAGQKAEDVLPADELTQDELQAIAYNAIPVRHLKLPCVLNWVARCLPRQRDDKPGPLRA